ncbi:MAG: hypothetical protein JTT16_04470, partial [Candidatus Brockarchaeota archaeon]|nr:hypothetical protein [Candidatus Brockarchaeota archaeon]
KGQNPGRAHPEGGGGGSSFAPPCGRRLVERIEWMEKNIERLNKKVKLLVVALILVSLLAAWGWLT